MFGGLHESWKTTDSIASVSSTRIIFFQGKKYICPVVFNIDLQLADHDSAGIVVIFPQALSKSSKPALGLGLALWSVRHKTLGAFTHRPFY